MYERLMTIPACYSADRVLEVVSQAVRLVLSNYAELVETHFPQIGPYLPLYSVLPVKVSAVIVPGGEHGPTWSHYLEPVEKGGANVVDIRLGRESDEAVLGAEWRRKVDHAAKALSASGRDPRIGASVLTTMSHSILEFWHDSILEDSVFSLLIRDFKKLFGKFAASGHEPTWHLL
jgi:hypothetical protein